MQQFGVKKVLVLIFLTLASISFLQAQNNTQSLANAVNGATITKDPNDTTKMTWKTGGLFQSHLQPGSNSATGRPVATNPPFRSNPAEPVCLLPNGKHSWDNFLNAQYGMTNTTSLGTRKTNDNLRHHLRYGYDMGKKFYLTALFDFRTQFAPGYNYPTTDTQGADVRLARSRLCPPFRGCHV
jgi:hypothetical protein